VRTKDLDEPAGTSPTSATFIQSARQAQLVACAIDALAEVGYQQTTVADVGAVPAG
jgi:AcrR family transcriptional regulator